MQESSPEIAALLYFKMAPLLTVLYFDLHSFKLYGIFFSCYISDYILIFRLQNLKYELFGPL